MFQFWNEAYDYGTENLGQLFSSSGTDEIVEVMYNTDTGQSRGFGFVTMSIVEEDYKAATTYNGYANKRLNLWKL
ncbi:28 kDa ribonucleoprotein, chloroplastic-like protein, partial [Tanacetum coccineum]